MQVTYLCKLWRFLLGLNLVLMIPNEIPQNEHVDTKEGQPCHPHIDHSVMTFKLQVVCSNEPDGLGKETIIATILNNKPRTIIDS